MDLKVVGQPVGRVEGPDKVSGKMLYTADVAAPEALCVASKIQSAAAIHDRMITPARLPWLQVRRTTSARPRASRRAASCRSASRRA